MEYKNEKLGCSFSLPDALTVRQQLSFWDRFFNGEGECNAVRNWEAGKSLITNWQCEDMPDANASLDEMTGVKQARIVTWAGQQVSNMIMGLEEPAPNS